MNSGIRAVYKSPNTVFAVKDLAAIWGITNYNYLKTRIQYYLKRGYLQRICHGLYSKDSDRVDIFEVGNKLRTPSYISFQTVLFREGMIFQEYSSTYLASYCSKTIETGVGEFVYHRLKDPILYYKDGITFSDTYCIASRERAFLDTIYLFKDYHIDNLRPLDWKKVGALMDGYASACLRKRIKEYRDNA